MESFPLLVDQANKAFMKADHLAYVTYPLVTDKKLLIVIVESIHQATRRAMEAILAYEYMYKRINHFPKDFENQLFLMRQVAERYNLAKSIIGVAREVNDLIQHREKSPIEFIRKDKFVIASENFQLKTVTIEKVKSYIQHIKYLVERLNEVKALYDRRTG